MLSGVYILGYYFLTCIEIPAVADAGSATAGFVRYSSASWQNVMRTLQETHVFNLSPTHCTFPDIWKSARITPLYKEGPHDNCSNYRPISVLPILSKMLERLVHNQVYHYIDHNNMLNECQAGFRKRNSTGTCLIEFLNEIYNNMDSGRLTDVLFLDLRLTLSITKWQSANYQSTIYHHMFYYGLTTICMAGNSWLS